MVAYYFITNLQGDVLQVFRKSDNAIVASYTYDSWGNILSAEGEQAEVNPFRYMFAYCGNPPIVRVDAAKSLRNTVSSAVGTYEILYKSGRNYVGKGGFRRAIQSAIEHAKPSKIWSPGKKFMRQ